MNINDDELGTKNGVPLVIQVVIAKWKESKEEVRAPQKRSSNKKPPKSQNIKFLESKVLLRTQSTTNCNSNV